MEPKTIPELHDQAQAILNEISKQMEEPFRVSRWMMDRGIWSRFTAFVELGISLSIDVLDEHISKALICDRLIKANQDMIDSLQKTVKKLKEIKDG